MDRILTVLRENIPNAILKSVLMIVMLECVDKVGDRIWKCQEAEKFRGARYLIIGLAIRKHLCKFVEVLDCLDDSEILRSVFYEL